MNRRRLSTMIACGLAAVAALPAAPAGAVGRSDGAYAFGCRTGGVDCAGTFSVTRGAVRALTFRPVRCSDGRVSGSPTAAIRGGKFGYSATLTSSVSVPVALHAAGVFATATTGSVKITYSASGVGCAAGAATYSFARGTAPRLGVQGWRDAGLVVDGAIDPDVVTLPDGRLRMYYVMRDGSDAFITSSVSSNGRTWTREATELGRGTMGPVDVVRLPDGRFRMHYTSNDDPDQAMGEMPAIQSALSDDGITWTRESGHRLEPSDFPALVPSGGTTYRLGHPGVARLANGTWLMLAAFSWDTPFNPQGMSSNVQTELIVWATSADGLSYTPRGIAVDSRNHATFDGFASSPDPVLWENGTVRAYFWSPGPQLPYDQKRSNALQYTTFTGTGWTTPQPVRIGATMPGAAATASNGSDPTSAVLKGRMLLFYGNRVETRSPLEWVEASIMTSTTYRLSVARTGGGGTVASGLARGAGVLRADGTTGLSCGSVCSTRVLAGTRVWLHATPAPGYKLAGWSGCNSSRPAGYPPPASNVTLCWVQATKDVTATARFARR